jgi:amino acid adenylation domain-containing protein
MAEKSTANLDGPAGATVSAAEGFRLSPAQRRLWLYEQRGVATRAVCAVAVEGPVAAAALREGIAALVRRHEALRTAFVRPADRKVALQVIAEEGDFAWAEEDLSELAAVEQGRRLDATFAAEVARPVDLERGPLLSARLAALAPDRAELVLGVPALCADGASLARLVAELAALVAGGGEALAEPLQYVDVAEWQRERREEGTEEAERGRTWWRRRLEAAPRAVALPCEHPDAPGFAPAWVELDLDGPRLQAAAAEHGAMVADLLRAAWWLLLHRAAGASAFAVAETLDGREEATASAVGPLARAVPLAVAVDGDARFAALVRQAARAHAEAAEWESWFAAAGEPEEEPRGAGFAHLRWPAGAPAAPASGTSFMPRRLLVAAPVVVQLAVLETGAGLAAEIVYDARRLDAADGERLGRQLRVLLDGALGEPAARVDDLPLLGVTERGQVVARWSDGGPLAARGAPVHRRFEARAAAAPEAPAVVVEEVSLSYGELNARANRLARALRRLGVGPEAPVALYLERSVDLVAALLAALKAGGAYVPFDTSQPARRLALMLEEVRPRAIVSQQSLAPHLPPGVAPLLLVDREGPDGEAIAREAAADLAVAVAPASLAYVVFTSGSTGRPKGVAVEHRQLAAYLDAVSARLGLEPGWSWASVSTLAADLGNTAIFPALAGGGCLHLVAPERATDPEALAAYLERHAVDGLKIVPTHLEALQSAGRPERLLPRRRLVLGGEASRRPWAEELRGLVSKTPGCRLFNHYGPAETTVGVLTYEVAGAVDPRCATLPIGRPLPGTRVYLLDRQGRPVAPWEAGEVHVGGAGLSRGYLHHPELTAERFVPDPFGGEPGGRLYRTGDLARLLPDGAAGKDGNVEFLGRRDHQVKFHGFRVELAEIRAALAAHPQIRDSVVLPARDGNGHDALVAYYVARQEIEAAALRALLAETLIEEVVPNLFVHLRRLPLTLNGKVNYAALPGIDEVRAKAASAFVAPRTAAEGAVAEVWSQVLGLARVSAEANFFALGGHSLLATRIVARLRERSGVELPLRAIFESPTVAGLARRIEEAGEAVPAIPAAAPGPIAAAGRSLDEQLAELEELTAEEAQALLEREAGGAKGAAG